MPLEIVELDQDFDPSQIVLKLPKKFDFTPGEIQTLGEDFQSKLIDQGKLDNNGILIVAWI